MEVDVNQEDPRVMVMYGVPFPDGSIARPVDENGNPTGESISAPTDDAVRFPDGSIAKPITEEEAARRIEELNAPQQDSVAVDIRPSLMYGVPFPEGGTVRPIEEQNDTKSNTEE